MQHHRHEDYVRRAVGERQRLAGRLHECDAVRGDLLACLVEHLLRRVDGRDVRAEPVRQRLREPAGAAAEVDDMRRLRGHMWREQAEPLLEPLRAQPPRRVVDAGDIRFVVVHRSLQPAQCALRECTSCLTVIFYAHDPHTGTDRRAYCAAVAC